jgi:hypothetical protein
MTEHVNDGVIRLDAAQFEVPQPEIILASHQPDFLPYSGFFYKIAKATIFDLAIYDQYTVSGYQRRVTMGGKWIGVAVPDEYNRKPIWQVRYNMDSIPRVMDAIYENYHNAPFYDRYAPGILYELATGNGNLMQLNEKLIRTICMMLEITTPIITDRPLKKAKGHGILEMMSHYRVNTYLSGAGAKEYIGDEFEKAGKTILWSKHDPITGDTVLDILFNQPNPMKYILKEHGDE